MSQATITIIRDDETGSLVVTVSGDGGKAQDIANDIMLTAPERQGSNFTGSEEYLVH